VNILPKTQKTVHFTAKYIERDLITEIIGMVFVYDEAFANDEAWLIISFGLDYAKTRTMIDKILHHRYIEIELLRLAGKLVHFYAKNPQLLLLLPAYIEYETDDITRCADEFLVLVQPLSLLTCTSPDPLQSP
jgi:hypothetical protein